MMTIEAGPPLKGKAVLKKGGIRRGATKSALSIMPADRILAEVKGRPLMPLPLLPSLPMTNQKASRLRLMMKNSRLIIEAHGEVNHCKARRTGPLFQEPTGPSVPVFAQAGIAGPIVRES